MRGRQYCRRSGTPRYRARLSVFHFDCRERGGMFEDADEGIHADARCCIPGARSPVWRCSRSRHVTKLEIPAVQLPWPKPVRLPIGAVMGRFGIDSVGL
jgi:hypothetical protein